MHANKSNMGLFLEDSHSLMPTPWFLKTKCGELSVSRTAQPTDKQEPLGSNNTAFELQNRRQYRGNSTRIASSLRFLRRYFPPSPAVGHPSFPTYPTASASFLTRLLYVYSLDFLDFCVMTGLGGIFSFPFDSSVPKKSASRQLIRFCM